jgi:DNA-binding transcriptional MocR family regulator
MQDMSERDFSGLDAATLTIDLAPSQQLHARPEPAPALYLQIALRLAQMVASGVLQPGQRLPSVRDAAAQNNVSVATVVQALATLEEHRLVQPRAKSVGDITTPLVSFAGYAPKDKHFFDIDFMCREETSAYDLW